MFEPSSLRDWLFLALEWASIAGAAWLLTRAARRGRRPPLWSSLRWLLANDRRPLIAVFLLALASGALTSVIRPAEAWVHDEYSYLLAADTFAHGRLTNPPHPFWRHFETFHVLQQPSYQSRYPPAQGLALAAGQALTGRPIVGAWLSLGLAAVAFYWCLRGWAPRRWALFGATLPAVRFGSGLLWDDPLWAYWGASYWGGAVAFGAASLVLGAAVRLMRRPQPVASALLGVGLGALAASRPAEGLLFSAIVGAYLLASLVRRRGIVRTLGALAPAAALAGVCLCGLLIYNKRVTGSPFSLPYTAYARAYDTIPVFTFQESGRVPQYRHAEMQRYHQGFMVDNFQRKKSRLGVEVRDVRALAGFFLGPTLLLATAFALRWRSPWVVVVLLSLVASGALHAVSLAVRFEPHYFAPFAPGLLLLTVQGLRVLYVSRFGGGARGARAATAIAASCFLVFFAAAGLRAYSLRQTVGQPTALEHERRMVVERLLQRGPKHLVFVRYAPDHNVHGEWVYNRAGIDEAPVVWAREMLPDDDRALRDYYSDRQAWIIEPDENPPRLYPFD